MKQYTIYFDSGIVKFIKANGICIIENAILNIAFFVDGVVVAEFNSEHIAGYSVTEYTEACNFRQKADITSAEGCFLDQGITQVF